MLLTHYWIFSGGLNRFNVQFIIIVNLRSKGRNLRNAVDIPELIAETFYQPSGMYQSTEIRS